MASNSINRVFFPGARAELWRRHQNEPYDITANLCRSKPSLQSLNSRNLNTVIVRQSVIVQLDRSYCFWATRVAWTCPELTGAESARFRFPLGFAIASGIALRGTRVAIGGASVLRQQQRSSVWTACTTMRKSDYSVRDRRRQSLAGRGLKALKPVSWSADCLQPRVPSLLASIDPVMRGADGCPQR